MRIWGAVVLVAILNAAVISDSLTGKIRNGLIILGLLLGFSYQMQIAGIAGIGAFAGGVLLPLVFTIPLYAFGAIGAGDGKLLAVVGGFLGMKAVPACLILTFLIGAVQAVLKMLYQRNLKERLHYLADYAVWCLRERRFYPYGQTLTEENAVIHLSAAILFASLIYMMTGGGL